MQTERATYNGNKKRIQEAVANLKPGDYIRLRRLTPRESLRLMGIDDKHIDKMLYDSHNDESEIFKQAGNSIIVDVMVGIFRRLFVDRIGPDEGQSYTLY